MAAGDHPLGRCKSYLAAFSAIDAAIEAADPDVSRDEFRRARSAVVETLCATWEQEGGEERNDELCLLLDQAMVQSLLTLRVVPITPTALTKTELLRSVQALKKQGSEHVRVLVRDIMRGWRASLQEDLVRVREMLSQIDRLSTEMQTETEAPFKNPSQQKMAAMTMSVGGGGTATGRVTGKQVAAALSTKSTALDQPPVVNKKKTTTDLVTGTAAAALSTKTTSLDQPPVVNKKKTTTDLVTAAASLSTKTTSLDQSTVVDKKKTTASASVASGDLCGSLSTKMEASKRKLREGYQEVENAKRQRKIQIIKAPEMVRQKERKQHPIFRERSRARSATTVRRSVFGSRP